MNRILPILFNTDMIRAILDGRKSVTRRVIKPQPDWFDCGLSGDKCIPMRACDIGLKDVEIKPPCRTGDILYVRETWQVFQTYPAAYGFDVMYRADQEIRPCIFTFERYEKFIKYEDSKNYPRWITSQFMPKEAARIWLKVTDVRVERLQEITVPDVIKEGVRAFGCDACLEVNGKCNPQCGEDKFCGLEEQAEDEFTYLWDSTIKKSDLALYGWEANPWVWAIEFERCEKPQEVQP